MTLTATNMSYRIGARPLVDAVTLAVEPGELVALIGPNGAGKSTLLKLMAGDLAPNTGDIVLNGAKLSRLDPMTRARARAVLPQDSTIAFGFCALEIVLLGRYPFCHGAPRAHDIAIARAALARLDVEHLEARVMATLSGGERARVQLARVVAQLAEASDAPRYLLLDEPTASLDPAHQHLALRVARELAAQGVGVLAVLHDLNLAARYADRIALLKRGRLSAHGTPHEVLTPTRLGDAFGIEATVMPHPRHGCPLIVAN